MLIINKIRNSFFAYAIAFVFACGNWLYLDAQKIEVHIALPLSGPELTVVRNTIAEIQEKVKKAAEQNGYMFDTSIASADKLHITLESAADVEDEADYEVCADTIAQETDALDITDQFQQAHLDTGFGKRWVVLSFPTSQKSALAKLVRQLKDCLKKGGLKLGRFPNFNAHVSLGKFVKDSKTPLPKVDSINWLPSIKIKLPKSSFIVKNLLFSTRERIINAATGETKLIEGPKHLIPLRSRQVRQANGADKEAILKAVLEKRQEPLSTPPVSSAAVTANQNNFVEERRLFKEGMGMRKRFAAALNRNTPQSVAQDIECLLSTIAARAAKHSKKAAVKMRLGQQLEYVESIFNRGLINQDAHDSVFKLSEHDTQVFDALPAQLQNELLQNRRIEFTRSKLLKPACAPALKPTKPPMLRNKIKELQG